MSDWLDIENLMRMAKQQPEVLEAMRKREVAALIDSAPESYRRRLRGLQFQIDCQRQVHKTPMGACVAISKMMHDSLNQLNQYLNGKKSHLQGSSEDLQVSSGQVIPFNS